MPYTFGAGTGDDINLTLQNTIGATARASLVCGWFYPTTLTATRGLWSASTIVGAEIDTTTSELRLRTDNTTDGQWTTTGALLATNKWSFLAFFVTCLNGTPAAAWKVWMGTVDESPREITVTQATAPVGNFSGATNLVIGNKGNAGTLAFQGDIAEFGVYNSASAAGALNPFSLAAHGAVQQSEADFILEHFVQPYWLGLGWTLGGAVLRRGETAFTSIGDEAGFISLDASGPAWTRYTESVAPPGTSVIPTINGATRSLNGSPRPLAVHSAYVPPVVRR